MVRFPDVLCEGLFCCGIAGFLAEKNKNDLGFSGCAKAAIAGLTEPADLSGQPKP